MSSGDYYGGQGHGYDGAHQQQQQGYGGYNQQQQYPPAPAYGQPQHDQYGQGHSPHPQQQVSAKCALFTNMDTSCLHHDRASTQHLRMTSMAALPSNTATALPGPVRPGL